MNLQFVFVPNQCSLPTGTAKLEIPFLEALSVSDSYFMRKTKIIRREVEKERKLIAEDEKRDMSKERTKKGKVMNHNQ